MVRSELTAEDSLAAMRARNRLGMAMAAMIRIIATTIKSSISENPFFFFKSFSSLVGARPHDSWFAVGQPLFEEAESPENSTTNRSCLGEEERQVDKSCQRPLMRSANDESYVTEYAGKQSDLKKSATSHQLPIASYCTAASSGTIVRSSFCGPRTTVRCDGTPTWASVNRRWRSSTPAICLPSKATTRSDWRKPALSAGLPLSTETTPIADSTGKAWKRTRRRGRGTVWATTPM